MINKEIIQKLLDRIDIIASDLEGIMAQYNIDENPTIFIQKIPKIISSLYRLTNDIEDLKKE